jgi:hypothetical protein
LRDPRMEFSIVALLRFSTTVSFTKFRPPGAPRGRRREAFGATPGLCCLSADVLSR